MEESTIALAIENVLTANQRRNLLNHVISMNPQLRGAKVADILSMFHDSDTAIQWTEPAWDEYGNRYVQLVPSVGSPEDTRRLAVLALLAAALIEWDTPPLKAAFAIAHVAANALNHEMTWGREG